MAMTQSIRIARQKRSFTVVADTNILVLRGGLGTGELWAPDHLVKESAKPNITPFSPQTPRHQTYAKSCNDLDFFFFVFLELSTLLSLPLS
jgi:hypothetical protein